MTDSTMSIAQPHTTNNLIIINNKSAFEADMQF